MGEDNGASRNRRDLLSAVASIATAGVVGLATYEFSQLNSNVRGHDTELRDLRSLLSEMQLEVAVLAQGFNDHDFEATRWKNLIERLQTAVHELETNAAARKDAFTGTEGAQHEAWIKENDKEIEALRSLIKTIQQCCTK